MSLESFFAEDPGYDRWRNAHPEGVVARLSGADGGLGIHRVWCDEATPCYGAPGGMSAIRLCSAAVDEVLEWAARRSVAGISRCKHCIGVAP